MAWEQVTLFGLVIVEKRRVNYSRINALEARRLFIVSALVRGELNTRSGFLRNNQQVREEIEAMEHKRRKHDVMVDESVLFDFFDARIPVDVCDSVRFEKWLETTRVNRGGSNCISVMMCCCRSRLGKHLTSCIPICLKSAAQSYL